MIPWELLDHVPVPDDGDELLLYRRGEEYSIRVNQTELMNSRSHGSEEALGELACGRLTECPSPRILIGGLGMGFTTTATLKNIGPSGVVIVAELVHGVVTWNQELLGHLAEYPLRDERVSVRVADVAHVMEEERGGFDAILLDVDNGPRGLSYKTNHRLYTRDGLKTTFAALRPAGVLAVWSATSDPEFSHRLRRSGFAVEEVRVRARGRSGGHHTIWLATRRT
ncbi:MAG: hypothetical protein WA705_16470 [Candidatus Ozemobacteraceae bacterium]